MITFEEFKRRIKFMKTVMQLETKREILWSEATYVVHCLELGEKIYGIKAIRFNCAQDLKVAKRIADAYNVRFYGIITIPRLIKA